MKISNKLSGALIAASLFCSATAVAQNPDAKFDSYPHYEGTDLELTVDGTGTHFALWSPEAQEAKVNLYNTDRNTPPRRVLQMTKGEKGVWRASVPEQLYGRFYTFAIKYAGKWLDETPGIWAKATGTNGRRAAIIDFAATNPEGWEQDHGPEVKNITDAVLYEMHHRDFSMHPSSGIVHKGKFLALTEEQTRNLTGEKTGIDHLKELGVTHVHILPPTTTTRWMRPTCPPTSTTGAMTRTTTTLPRAHTPPTRPIPPPACAR